MRALKRQFSCQKFLHYWQLKLEQLSLLIINSLFSWLMVGMTALMSIEKVNDNELYRSLHSILINQFPFYSFKSNGQWFEEWTRICHAIIWWWISKHPISLPLNLELRSEAFNKFFITPQNRWETFSGNGFNNFNRFLAITRAKIFIQDFFVTKRDLKFYSLLFKLLYSVIFFVFSLQNFYF